MPADDLQIDRHAAIERTVLAPNSWVEIVPGFIRDATSVFTELHDTLPWQQTEVLRYDRYVPERRLGVGVNADSRRCCAKRSSPEVTVSRPVHRRRRDPVTARTSRVCTVTGRCGGSTTRLIAIVVLGTRRPFVLRPRADGVRSSECAGSDPDDVVLMPGEGDLLVMGGACQREWLHGVPQASTIDGAIPLDKWFGSFHDGSPEADAAMKRRRLARGGRTPEPVDTSA
jgi:hypothetical protein